MQLEFTRPWVRFPAGLRCVFSSDPVVSSSIFVGAEREENLIRKWVVSRVLNLVNVLDSRISFGSAFQRTIDRGTKLDNVDDFLVAGTGYPDFRNEYPVDAEARWGRSVHKYGGATLDLIL